MRLVQWLPLLAVGVAGTAFAGPITVTGSVGGAPTGVSYENFDSLPLGTGGGTLASGVSVSFAPDAQAVQGGSAGVYAPPFLSGGNGTGFGNADGADTTTYLAAGATNSSPGAAITITLPALEKYVGLLWGSVDTFNTLQLFDGATLVGTVTGSNVTASPNGDQGVNGTLYVNIMSSIGFDRLVATSSSHTFELDNLAFNPTTPIPEAGTLALVGLGALCLGAGRRRRID